MPNINVTIRMDEELQKEATSLFDDLGISLNQAITLFIKQALREQGIPFIISRNVPNKDTINAFKEIELMKAGVIPHKTYDDVDEMFNDVLKWNTKVISSRFTKDLILFYTYKDHKKRVSYFARLVIDIRNKLWRIYPFKQKD